MKKLLIIFCGLILLIQSIQTSFAEMLLFTGQTCPFCKELEKYLEENNFYEKFNIQTYEIYNNEANLMFYVKTSQDLGYKGGAVPLLVDGKNYEDGADDIIAYLENSATDSADGTGISASIYNSDVADNPNTLENSDENVTKLSKTDSEMLNAIVKEEAANVAAETLPLSESSDQIFNITNLLILIAVLLASGILYFFLGNKK